MLDSSVAWRNADGTAITHGHFIFRGAVSLSRRYHGRLDRSWMAVSLRIIHTVYTITDESLMYTVHTKPNGISASGLSGNAAHGFLAIFFCHN